jgi:deoxyadenosine/deoxycytidine kinase
MHKKPKIILIYAFAGIGKTTLAKRLNDDMPLSLCIEGDELLTMIGQWLENEEQAREYVFEMTKALMSTYLNFGHDVIVPYLLTNESHSKEFESIAKKHDIDLIEVYLKASKSSSVQYLLERGVWGEKGAPPIKKTDIPNIEQIYDDMSKAMKSRKNCIEIQYERNKIDKTHQMLKEISGVE